MDIREQVLEKFFYIRNSGSVCIKPRSVKDNGDEVRKNNFILWSEIISKTLFLDDGCEFIQRLWHIYNEVYEYPLCCFCKKQHTKFRDFIFGYNTYCCASCAAKGSSSLAKQTKLEKYGNENYNNREKYNETCLDRYGVDNPFQSDYIKEKIKISNMSLHGVEYPMQNKNILNKSKNTIFAKYGVDHISQSYYYKTKYCNTSLERYGTYHPMQNKIIINKTKQTNIIKYGVKNPTQNALINQRASSFKNAWHKYILPSGKEIFLQGYEPLGMDNLLLSYNEDEIKFKRVDMPEIWYVTPDKTWHRYFADFYIPKDNLIVEIKSEYTYNKTKDLNILKKEACLYLGYKYLFLIFTKSSNIIEEEDV